MKAARILLSCALLVSASAARAQFSSTVTLVSDYEFRGVSLSQTDPALQASLDYAFANGLGVGAWASSLDYGEDYDGSLELDLYASYSADISDTAAWSVGLTAYTYPDSHGQPATATRAARLKIEPYVEGYVDITTGSFNLAQWYTDDFAGLGVGELYTEFNFNHALPRGFKVMAHAGYSWGDYWEDPAMGGGELFDYSFGLSYDAGHFALAGKITGTDASGEQQVTSGAFANDARLVFSIETTFPWEGK
jgi:uncharacterized protein (TIGR02001 family)